MLNENAKEYPKIKLRRGYTVVPKLKHPFMPFLKLNHEES